MGIEQAITRFHEDQADHGEDHHFDRVHAKASFALKRNSHAVKPIGDSFLNL